MYSLFYLGRVHVKSGVYLKAVPKIRLKIVVPMLSMEKWLNNYFGFTKREYNALLALFGLILLAFVTPYAYEQVFVQVEKITDIQRLSVYKLNLIAQQETHSIKFRRSGNPSPANFSIFKFDPNTISIQQWQQLGLSPKQAQSILNYRNKGGKFYKADDLKKMYAISPKVFERLKSSVDIPRVSPNVKEKSETKKHLQKEFVLVEINSADTVKLDEIKGIGLAFARRIVKYRDRLGGFYKKEQLMEVFGLDSVKFREIEPQIVVDVSMIKKININAVDFDALKVHPYLKYKQINAIIEYRKQHGSYKGIADLKKILILSPQTIEQLTPYLQF